MWFHQAMRFYTAFVLLAVALLGGVSAFAGGNKGKAARVSFHIETAGTDNPKMIFPHEIMGQQRYFRRIPEVSSKDLVAFSPFPAEDQASYGAIFQLKDPARRRLAAVTADNIGKWLVCQAFGRLVDGVMIDATVDDGAVVIWSGLTVDEVKELDKSMPRIGEKKKR